jgi:hypothetical protein
MAGLEPAGWGEYFVASIGAGAALAGLVFVAISINLRDVLRYPGLVGRAAEALALLLSPVFVGLVGVSPSDGASTTGLEIALVALVIWAVVAGILARALRGPRAATNVQLASRIVLAQAATIPPIVAGVSLATGVGAGLHWLVVGALLSITAGVFGAWVLLIEIQR